MLKIPMNKVTGRIKARLPSYPEILESENKVVRAIVKKLVDMPFRIIANRKRIPLDAPSMNPVIENVIVRSTAIRRVKII